MHDWHPRRFCAGVFKNAWPLRECFLLSPLLRLQRGSLGPSIGPDSGFYAGIVTIGLFATKAVWE